MNTQGAIIEGLRTKRQTSLIGIGNMKTNPAHFYKVISEKKCHNLTKCKASKRKTITYPKISLKESVNVSGEDGIKSTAIYLYDDGDKYVGEVCDGLPDGIGTAISAYGDVFWGDWTKGTPNGRGHYIWADGWTYTGGLVNGSRHGEGICTSPNGEIFDVQYDHGNLLTVDGTVSDNAIPTGKK